jgi:hypothetical protein
MAVVHFLRKLNLKDVRGTVIATSADGVPNTGVVMCHERFWQVA